jgi:hypothetical protein
MLVVPWDTMGLLNCVSWYSLEFKNAFTLVFGEGVIVHNLSRQVQSYSSMCLSPASSLFSHLSKNSLALASIFSK